MLLAKKTNVHATSITNTNAFFRDVAVTNSSGILQHNFGDVAVTNPSGILQHNFGNWSSDDPPIILHQTSLRTSQTEFDWINNTNPFQRLRNLLILEDNWDGYGATKFSIPHISRALELYSSIYHYYLSNGINFSQLSPFIAPCSNGSILFEWSGKRFSTKELEIFVPSNLDRYLEYLKSNNELEEEESCVIGEIVALLDWLFALLLEVK